MTATYVSRLRAVALGLIIAAVGAVAFSLATATPSQAFGVPLPYYTITATSGDHEASLANLPIGLVGVPVVPVAVDIDGDLLPDVTVAVNLVNPAGLLKNPPNIPGVAVPNVEINRIITSPVLGQSSPPLHIEVGITVADTEGGPNTVIKFGYDTGPGGTIPTRWKALLGGIENLYNPLEAIVDTGPSSGSNTTYEGPLRITGSIESGDATTDLGFHYRPFPNKVHVVYGSDDAGQHIDYAHHAAGPVDLDTNIDSQDNEGEFHVDARIDRLPPAIKLDLTNETEDSGSVTYAADADGRLPDVDVHVESSSTDPDKQPLVADVDIEALPAQLTAAWSLPKDGPVNVVFDAEGNGIGAVDVDIRNYEGDSPWITDWVPTEQQHLSLHQAGDDADHPHRRIIGRIERVRHVNFSHAGRSLDVGAQAGDGALPLEFRYLCTVACSEDNTVASVDAHGTVAPLPDDIVLSLDTAGEDQEAEPLAVTYDGSQVTDVDVHLETRKPGLFEESPCGAVGSVCADIAMRNVPTHIEAEVAKTKTAEETNLRVDVDTNAATLKPDLFATVILGPEDQGEKPLVAEADAWGLPAHARVRLHERFDDETQKFVVDKAQFFACAPDFTQPDPGCPNDPASQIGALDLSLRSFTDRPEGFPIVAPTEPLYATVTGRGDDSEIAAHFTRIGQVQYLNTGSLLGVRAHAGDGNEPFAARIDLQDIDLGDGYELNDKITLDAATQDLAAEAVVANLPATFDVCFRSANKPLDGESLPLTAPCVDDSPFAAAVQPLAVAYRLADDAEARSVSGTFEETTSGTRTVVGAQVPYSETTRGEASAPDVPTELTTWAELPAEDADGPIRARYNSDGQIDLTFRGESRVNDAQCLDPRTNARALCVSGVLENIPTSATLDFDPTSATDNLAVTTGNQDPGDDPVNLVDVNLTSVSPGEATGTQDTLIVRGDLTGLPEAVHGTVALPEGDDPEGPVTISICASTQFCSAGAAPDGLIDNVTIDVQNFVVPDPTPLGDDDTSNDMPPQRTVNGADLLPPTQTVVLYGRGDDVHARLAIGNVAGAGYRTVASAEGERLETQELSIDFGVAGGDWVEPVIRTYADIDEGTAHTIVDATLKDIPAGLRMCFRGADPDASVDPAPGTATWCDGPDDANGTSPTDRPAVDDGAFELRGRPGADLTGLDAAAFLRRSTGGGVDVMSGSVFMEDVPFLVQGTFPGDGGGSLDVGGFNENGDPDGFGVIDFEVASFDLPDTGYGLAEPWARRKSPPGAPFPAPVLGPQHLSLVVTDTAFHARGRIDGLNRLAMRDGVCTARLDPASNQPLPDAILDRADYPYYPEAAAGTQPYTCVRAEVQDGAGEPLDLHAFIDDEGSIVSLTEAGVTALPQVLQLMLADVDGIDQNAAGHPFKTPCGTAVDPNCVPPLARVDTQGAPAQMFGKMQVGTAEHLEELNGVPVRGNVFDQATFSDLDDPLTAPGARVRVGTWSADPDDLEVEAGEAARVNFLLDVPYSFTLDNPQSWDDSHKDGATEYEATDLRLHYVARSDATTVIPSLGDMKVLVHSAPGNGQVLVSGGTLDSAVIPGELALGMYIRDDIAERRMFAQVDGTTSTDVSLQAVILAASELPTPEDIINGNVPDPSMERIAIQVLDLPASPFVSHDDPGFRLQSEVIDDSTIEPPATCDALSCDESESVINEIRGVLDFDPAGRNTNRAKLVRAVMRTSNDGMQVQMAAYDDMNAATGADGNAEVNLEFAAHINPMRVYTYKGIPFIGSVDFEVDAKLSAAVTVDRATNYTLAVDAIHLRAKHQGSGTESYIGPINLYPRTLYGGVNAAFTTVVGFDYFPPYPVNEDPLALDFFNCNAGDLIGAGIVQALSPGAHEFLLLADGYPNGTGIDANEEVSVLAFPDFNPAANPSLHGVGIGNIVIDFLAPAARSILCLAFDPAQLDLITANAPSNPQLITGHDVPDTGTFGKDPAVVNQQPPTYEDGVIESANGSDPVALCGAKYYRRLTINSPINVSPVALDPESCPEGSESSLSIFADEIEVNAPINADAIVDGECTLDSINFAFESGPGNANPIDGFGGAALCEQYLAGNRGASHGYIGGTGMPLGLNGTHDYIYGRGYPFDPKTEAGWRGGGAGGGKGGGVINLTADLITLNAELSADGGDGASVSSADACPASGSPGPGGAGGGSGGGVSIVSPKVVFGPGGVITTNGGNGGNGTGTASGGGGGSFGNIKLMVQVPVGYVPGTSAMGQVGLGGTSEACLPGDNAGSGLQIELPPGGDSEAHAMPEFWNGTDDDTDLDGDGNPELNDLHVRFSAAAASKTDHFAATNNDGFNVVLCGVRVTPDMPDFEAGFQFLMPNTFGSNVSSPCGLTEIAGQPLALAVELGRTHIDPGVQQIRFGDGYQFVVDDMADGYWGLYTRVVQPTTPGNDCFDPTDFPNGDPLLGIGYDDVDCNGGGSEPFPEIPDMMVGIDNTNPTDVSIIPSVPEDQIDLGDPANPDNDGDDIYYTNNQWVHGTASASDMYAGVAISGIAELKCYEFVGTPPDHTYVPFDCPVDEEGAWAARLSNGDGEKDILVEAIDLTGNRAFDYATVRVDTEVPTSAIAQFPVAGSERANGWFSTSPHFEISGFADPVGESVASPAHPDGRYIYQVDDGEEHPCPVASDVCTIPDEHLPGPGRHTIYFTAYDKAGNRGERSELLFVPPMHSWDVFVDGDAPTAAPYAAPFDADGSGGWYTTRPWIGIGTYDPPVGGSGVDGNVPPSVLQYRIDSNGQVGSTLHDYDAPFRLGAGTHSFCVQARDVAGNPVSDLELYCPSTVYRVDPTPPSVAFDVTPSTPDGGFGWYVSPVTLSVSASDLPSLLEAGAETSGVASVLMSVDGGVYGPAAPVVLGEGTHVVRAYAIDVAGNQSAVVERRVNVDQSHPVTTARVFTPSPALGSWYRAEPRVVLRSTDGDQNAGVERIDYRINGGSWQTYTEPVTMAAGHHTIEYRGVDRSGVANEESVKALSFHTDVTPPTATALEPQPKLWSRLFGPPTASLKWQISDDLGSKAKVVVLIYNVLGQQVRRIDAGEFTITPGQTLNGSTSWNGKSNTLLDLVPLGIYHYRIVVTDEAGNVAQSGESKPIQITLL